MQRTGVRRLLALVKGLPQTATSARPEESWTRENELAARIAETIDAVGRAQLQAWTGKDAGNPLVIEHPGRTTTETAKAEPRRVSIVELAQREQRRSH